MKRCTATIFSLISFWQVAWFVSSLNEQPLKWFNNGSLIIKEQLVRNFTYTKCIYIKHVYTNWTIPLNVLLLNSCGTIIWKLHLFNNWTHRNHSWMYRFSIHQVFSFLFLVRIGMESKLKCGTQALNLSFVMTLSTAKQSQRNGQGNKNRMEIETIVLQFYKDIWIKSLRDVTSKLWTWNLEGSCCWKEVCFFRLLLFPISIPQQVMLLYRQSIGQLKK